MLALIKRFLLFMDMIVNYGISPSTILKNREILLPVSENKAPDLVKDMEFENTFGNSNQNL